MYCRTAVTQRIQKKGMCLKIRCICERTALRKRTRTKGSQAPRALPLERGRGGGAAVPRRAVGAGAVLLVVRSAGASSAQRPPGPRPSPSAGVTGSPFSVARAQVPQRRARATGPFPASLPCRSLHADLARGAAARVTSLPISGC